MSDRFRTYVFVGAGLLFLTVGTVVFGWSVLAVQGAETTEGTVLDSRLASQPDDDSTGREYRADITYRYTVDGETYRSSNVYPTLFTAWGGREGAKEKVQRYPENESITVHYGPDDPSQAFLIPDYNWLGLAFMIGGLLATGAGIGARRNSQNED